MSTERTHARRESGQLHALILRAKERDQEAFAALLSRYTPLLESRLQHVRSANMTEEDMEDLRQEAYLSFYRALMHYDLEQSEVEFGLYAKICIDNGLYSALRGMKHLKRAPILPLEVMDEPPDDYLTDPSEQLIEQEKFNALYATIETTLSPLENRIWRLYITGQTAATIAASIGKDEKAVHNAIYRIRKKLRATLAE
ncbi:MAG: sigma-70 family RNA polymerase sigma factor [Clostridia bacterium]|nr:sigma-70 family RNA polymerase sigma factor [Clostridia bacterium]